MAFGLARIANVSWKQTEQNVSREAAFRSPTGVGRRAASALPNELSYEVS